MLVRAKLILWNFDGTTVQYISRLYNDVSMDYAYSESALGIMIEETNGIRNFFHPACYLRITKETIKES